MELAYSRLVQVIAVLALFGLFVVAFSGRGPTTDDFHEITTNLRISKNKTICLLFNGLVKNIAPQDAQSIRDYIVTPLTRAGYAVEAILSTQNVTSFQNPRNGEDHVPIHFEQSVERLKEVMTIRHMITSSTDEADSFFPPLNELLTEGDPWPDNPRTSLTYFLRQMYTLKRGVELLEKEADHFAGAVILRPDLRFLSQLNVKLFTKLIDQPDELAVAVPVPFHERYCFGNTKSMIKYGSRTDELVEYSKQKMPHAEFYAIDYMKKHKMKTPLVDWRAQRIRANGQVEHRDFWMATNPPEVLDRLRMPK